MIIDTIDFTIPDQLYKLYLKSGARDEGSLLAGDPKYGKVQIEYLYNLLTELQPKNLIEIGSHCGHFYYLATQVVELKDIHLYTFGDQAQSGVCIQKIKELFNVDNIDFIHGNSTMTLTSFNPNTNIDFAWVDGGHDFFVALSDLINCARLKVTHICVDDTNQVNRVGAAVREFLATHEMYELAGESPECGVDDWDWGGIQYLKRNDV